MKLHLFLVLVLAQTACTTTVIQKNDLNRYGYHGPVKKIVSYKYTHYTGIIDSANFNVRTLFDYNEEGNVHYMQLVINRSMFNQTSTAIDFHYKIKDGVKTGWKEININEQDTSYGIIEWWDKYLLFERKYNSDNQVAYEITTELDSTTFIESVANVKQFANDKAVADKNILNLLKDGEPYLHIHTDLMSGTMDTVFIEILQKDSLGNAIQLIERMGSTGSRTFIRKDFFYY